MLDAWLAARWSLKQGALAILVTSQRLRQAVVCYECNGRGLIGEAQPHEGDRQSATLLPDRNAVSFRLITQVAHDCQKGFFDFRLSGSHAADPLIGTMIALAYTGDYLSLSPWAIGFDR